MGPPRILMGTQTTGIYEEEGQLFRPVTPLGKGAVILGDIHRASSQICGIYNYVYMYLFTVVSWLTSGSFIHSLISYCLFIRGVYIY